MKWKRQEINRVNNNREPMSPIMAHVHGWIAVHSAQGVGWIITHVPTGCRLESCSKLKNAKRLARAFYRQVPRLADIGSYDERDKLAPLQIPMMRLIRAARRAGLTG